jgi:hypothetical protein
MAQIAPNLLRIEILIQTAARKWKFAKAPPSGSAGSRHALAIIRRDMGQKYIRPDLRPILPGKQAAAWKEGQDNPKSFG